MELMKARVGQDLNLGLLIVRLIISTQCSTPEEPLKLGKAQ